jgi:hypothetical protein
LGGSVRLGLRCCFLCRHAVSLYNGPAEDVSPAPIAFLVFDQFGITVNRRQPVR